MMKTTMSIGDIDFTSRIRFPLTSHNQKCSVEGTEEVVVAAAVGVWVVVVTAGVWDPGWVEEGAGPAALAGATESPCLVFVLQSAAESEAAFAVGQA